MRKFLVAVALCAASVGAWAQQTNWSFDLISSQSGLDVGGGFIDVAANPIDGPFSGATGSLMHDGGLDFLIPGVADQNVTQQLYFTNGALTSMTLTAFALMADAPFVYQGSTYVGTYIENLSVQLFTYPSSQSFKFSWSQSFESTAPTLAGVLNLHNTDSGTVQFTTPVPEPSTCALIGLGVGLIALHRRRPGRPVGTTRA